MGVAAREKEAKEEVAQVGASAREKMAKEEVSEVGLVAQEEEVATLRRPARLRPSLPVLHVGFSTV